MRVFFTASIQALHGTGCNLAYASFMTRLFWALIAVFPVPLVVLLLAGPPELFERERVLASRDVIERLGTSQVDWNGQFAQHKRIHLARLLPDMAAKYARFDIAFEYQTTPDRPVLVASTGFDTQLRYRLSDACWEMPKGQLTLMRRC